MPMRLSSSRLPLAGIFCCAVLASAAYAQPSFGPESFLSRMDQNGNGVLEPNEVSDRMRGFLERIAESDRSINLSQPIPISRLVQAMERARERSGGSGGGEDRDRGSERDSNNSRGGSTVAPVAPLVLGFATDDLPPVLGFGEDPAPPLKVADRDTREAAERLERYDRNKDGFLDKQELSEGRWSGSPMEFDRNRDGRLSRDELAQRYAKRRIEEENEKAARDSSSSSNSRSSGSGFSSSSRSGSSNASSSSSGVDPRMAGIVSSVMGRYDKNQNGYLDRSEWGEMRSDPSGGDKNRDGRISKEEMAAWLSERFQGGGSGDRGGGDRGDRGDRSGGGGGDRGDRGGFSRWGGGEGGGGPGGPFGGGFGGPPGGGGFGGPPGEGGQPSFYSMRGGWGGGEQGETRRDSSRSEPSNRSGSPSDAGSGAVNNTGAYRFQSTQERISEQFSLPDAFHRSDANGDGQIAMSEYASEWPESKVKEFLTLDKNGDGIITAAEYAAALQSGFKPGSSPATSSVTSTAPSTSAAASSTPSSGSSAGAAGYTEATASSPSSISSAADKYLGYAKGVVAKYDENKNGVLEKEEASKVSVVKPDTDADGNGQITAEELAASLAKK